MSVSSDDSDLFGSSSSSDSSEGEQDTKDTPAASVEGKDTSTAAAEHAAVEEGAVDKGPAEHTAQGSDDGDLFGDDEGIGQGPTESENKKTTESKGRASSGDSDNLFGESDDEDSAQGDEVVVREQKQEDGAGVMSDKNGEAASEERLVNVDDDMSDASSTGLGPDRGSGEDDKQSSNSDDESEEGSQQSPKAKVHTVKVHDSAPSDVFSDGRCHIVKLMPTVTGIDPIPFSRDTFPMLHAAALEKCPDEKSRAAMTSRAENSIRWRFKEGSDNKEIESNARLVEWADGSLTLMVGKESFKVLKRDERVYIYDKGGPNPPGFTTNGVPVLGAVNDMSCHGLCTSQLTVTPGSLESRTHKNLARWVIRPHGESLKGQKKKTSLTTTDEVLAAQAKAEQSLEDSRFALSAASRRKDMLGRRGMSEAFLESGMGSASPSGARGIHSLKQQYKKRRRTMKDTEPDVERDGG
ncbi:Paf1 complex component [Perkinsus olseni]|uniref:Paf1 complex component n=1 Tax=Perkinsus olseni TaxID=32597 RepID=A0A7J6U0V9_PEROL|nr:Paf1 complex component [Perkinsus olseni]